MAAVHLGTEDQGIGCAQVGCCGLAWHSHGKAQEPESAEFTVRTAQAWTEPRFPLPAPIHASRPSPGMHDFRYRLCHLRSVPCFPWCVLWERRGNSSPHSGPHTWVAAGTTSHPCQLCPWSSPPGPSHAVPPAWESGWEVLGQGSSWGGMLARDGGPSVPTHPYNPKP